MRDIDKILSNIDNDDNLEKLLKQDSDDLNEKKIVKKEEASDILESVDNTVKKDASDEMKKSFKAVSKEKEKQPEDMDFEIQFSIKGSKSWNTRDPYLIEIDNKQLHDDILNLKDAFFFIDSPRDENQIREDAKKAILNSFRTQKQGHEQEYGEFIKHEIETELTELIKYFIEDKVLDSLFIFHMGPNTMFRILQNKFIKQKYGFCYKSVSSNKAMRFLPEEYIKYKILNWFESNVNNKTLDVDSIQQYEMIRSIVAKKYQIIEKEFSKKLYEINSKIEDRKNISKEKLLRMKGDLWFGISNIIVYKRFVNKTIFH